MVKAFTLFSVPKGCKNHPSALPLAQGLPSPILPRTSALPGLNPHRRKFLKGAGVRGLTPDPATPDGLPRNAGDGALEGERGNLDGPGPAAGSPFPFAARAVLGIADVSFVLAAPLDPRGYPFPH